MSDGPEPVTGRGKLLVLLNVFMSGGPERVTGRGRMLMLLKLLCVRWASACYR